MLCQFKGGCAVFEGLIRVASVDSQVRKIDKDAAATAGGEVASKRSGEGRLGEVESAESRVARASLLGDAGTIEPEPAAVVELTGEVMDCFGVVQGLVARVEIAQFGVEFGLHCRYPLAR